MTKPPLWSTLRVARAVTAALCVDNNAGITIGPSETGEQRRDSLCTCHLDERNAKSAFFKNVLHDNTCPLYAEPR